MSKLLRKTILLVEDEYFLAEAIKMRLEHSGYEVLTAENGLEAIELLLKRPVHLIIMDIMLPVMDGFEATKKIRAHDKLKNKPILFLTAKARPEDKEVAMAVGANEYVVKPFDADVLLSLIKKWLEIS